MHVRTCYQLIYWGVVKNEAGRKGRQANKQRFLQTKIKEMLLRYII